MDTSRIGLQSPPLDVEIERGRLRLFCKAIGETGAIHTDPAAARAAGYRDVVAPPTFAFCLDSDRSDGFSMVRELGLPLGRLLHGGQSMTHHGPLCAGDRVVLHSRVTDIHDKKGGALRFFVIASQVLRAAGGSCVVEMERTLIVRQA